MSDILKPCPFCGGEAKVYSCVMGDTDQSAYWVECGSCFSQSETYYKEEQAIEAWNTRPNPWHTGTPTEKGWYLIKYECLVEGRYKGKLTYRAVHIYYDKYGIYNEDGSIGNDEVWKPIEYQIIEQNKETE